VKIMNDLKVTGKQDFMGKEIPVVLGGFGPDKRCVCDKVIAEIHNMNTFDIRRRIADNIKRFQENIDYIDLIVMREMHNNSILSDLGYTAMQIAKAEHIYLLSERGYAKLIKIMDSDLAWEIHDKLIDEYFQLREQSTNLSTLSPQLQFMIKVELEQKKMQQDIEKVNQRVDGIRDVVALNVLSWREDAKKLIVKIAQAWGGNEYIAQVNQAVYAELNQRMGVNLKQRRTNKRRKMAEEGISKSRQEKVTYVDVIADDKKLIEGYLAIVKEMAIKYGVADESFE